MKIIFTNQVLEQTSSSLFTTAESRAAWPQDVESLIDLSNVFLDFGRELFSHSDTSEEVEPAAFLVLDNSMNHCTSVQNAPSWSVWADRCLVLFFEPWCRFCSGAEDVSPKSVLCCLWFCGDLPPGRCGGFAPPWGQAAGVHEGLCRGFSWSTGGCCSDHSSRQVRGEDYSVHIHPWSKHLVGVHHITSVGC